MRFDRTVRSVTRLRSQMYSFTLTEWTYPHTGSQTRHRQQSFKPSEVASGTHAEQENSDMDRSFHRIPPPRVSSANIYIQVSQSACRCRLISLFFSPLSASYAAGRRTENRKSLQCWHYFLSYLRSRALHYLSLFRPGHFFTVPLSGTNFLLAD